VICLSGQGELFRIVVIRIVVIKIVVIKIVVIGAPRTISNLADLMMREVMQPLAYPSLAVADWLIFEVLLSHYVKDSIWLAHGNVRPALPWLAPNCFELMH
jgi:hypothetical protein